jgi:hypothetical protein
MPGARIFDVKPEAKLLIVKYFGRGERIRTSDPLVPNQVLYQAEPLPELAVGRMLRAERSLAEPFINARELHPSVSEGLYPGRPRVHCGE